MCMVDDVIKISICCLVFLNRLQIEKDSFYALKISIEQNIGHDMKKKYQEFTKEIELVTFYSNI